MRSAGGCDLAASVSSPPASRSSCSSRSRDAPPGRAARRDRAWFRANDSTYQIELAGDLVDQRAPRTGTTQGLGLERLLQPGRSSSAIRRRPTRWRSTHFAYFPAPLDGGGWGVVPSPFRRLPGPRPARDHRLLLAVAPFDAPLPWRLASARRSLRAPSSCAVRGSARRRHGILALLLAFGLSPARACLGGDRARRRYYFKQVAAGGTAALRHAPGAADSPARCSTRCGIAFVAVRRGVPPLLVADAARWARPDQLRHGLPDPRLRLSALLLNAGVIDDRSAPTRSRCSRSSSGCRSRPGSSSASAGRAVTGRPPPASRSRSRPALRGRRLPDVLARVPADRARRRRPPGSALVERVDARLAGEERRRSLR